MATTEKKAKTAREALLMAADLLSKRGAWTQGWFAKDAQGQNCFCQSDQAVAWCGLGAMRRVAKDYSPVVNEALARLKTLLALPEDGFVIWNDAPTRTQEEVIAALRKAAEL